MIKSAYISDILQLLLDDNILSKDVRKQLEFLSDDEYKYTGSGVFVNLSHSDGIESFRSRDLSSVLDGVTVHSTELSSEAKAILHLNEGLIDYLEIWSTDGNYPEKDLTKYTISQKWVGSPLKQVVKK